MEVINAIGRRKSAVARVYLTEGTGKITINMLIVILPVPSVRYTRATALLRRPIALITSILP